MPSRSDVETLRAANAELSRLVEAELSDFFASMSGASPEAVRDALLEVVPALVSEYGDVAATASAEWFEQVYGSPARLAAPLPSSAVQQGVRFAAGHLWTPEPAAIIGLLSTQLDKWVKQPGRDTISRSAERAGLRYARVPSGSKTCAFCLTMASRDAVYLTRRSAGDLGRGVGDDYHGKCDCAVVAIRDDDDLPAGYNPNELYEVYSAARKAAQGDDPDIQAFAASLDSRDRNHDVKVTAFAMRRNFPDLVTDAVHEH